MKRYNIYSLALALCIGAVSCQKDFDETLVDGATQGGTQITFTVEPSSTRVDVDGLAVTWSEGDQVMFFNTGSGSVVDGDCLTAEINSNYSNIASFSGTVTPSSGKLLGFYPASGAHINNGNQYLSSMLRLVQPLYLELSYDAEGEITPSSLAPYCYMLVKSNEELSSTSANNLTGSMEHLMAYVDLDLNIPSGKKLERVFIALTSTTTTLPVQSMKISAADGSVTYDDYVDNMTTVDTGAAWHLMDYMVLELTGNDGNLGTSVNADGVVPVRIPFIPQTLADTWTIFATYTDGTESIQKSEINNTLEAGKVYTREIDLQTTSGATTTPKLGDYYYSDGTYSTNLDASKTVDGLVTRLYVNGVDTNISQVASPYAKYSTFMEDAYTSSYTQWNPLATGNASSGQNASVADIITTVARIKTLVDADNAYYAEINMDMTYLEILEKVFPGSHAFAFALNSNTADGSPDYTTYSPNGTTLASDNENIWHLGSVQDYMGMANDVAMLQGGKGKNYFFKQEAGYPASVTSNENFVTLFPLDSDGNDTYDRVTLYAGKQTNTGKTDELLATIMALETTMDSGRKYGSSSINNTGKPTCTYANTYYKANSLGSYTRSSGSVIYTTVTGQQVTHLYPTLEKLYFRPIKRVNYAKSEGTGDTYNPTVSVSIDNVPSTMVTGDDIDLTASSSTNDGAEVTYVWSLGDGDTAYATLEGNKLTATAEGTITLTVTATAGSAVDSESIEITIYATNAKFTVTFNDGTSESKVEVEANGTVAEPTAPTANDYVFAGWYAGTDYSAEFDFTTPITADTTINALMWSNSESSYSIATAGQLAAFRDIVNGGNYTAGGTLSADIDLKSENWTPIGCDGLGTSTILYKGTFDGASHTISNLYVYQAYNSIGFFGDLGGATIKNVTFKNAVAKANGTRNRVGVVAGYLVSGTNTFSKCYVTGTSTVTGNANIGGMVGIDTTGSLTSMSDCSTNASVTSASAPVGGIIGYACGMSATYDTFVNCSNSGVVSGGNPTGGVIGKSGYTTLTNCSNSGSVESSSNQAAGIVGSLDVSNSPTKFYQCYNTGNVTGASIIGGITGQNSSVGTTIVGCYNSGTIEATNGNSAGIIGNLANDSSVVVACYNTGKIIGTGTIGGIVGNNAKTGATVYSCYNTGSVTGGSTMGALSGNLTGSMYNSYWISVTGLNANGSTTGTITDCSSVSSIADLSSDDVLTALNKGFSNETYPYYFVAGTSTASPTVVAGTYVAPSNPTDSDTGEID